MLCVNPHAWISVDVKKPDGTVEEWMIETGTPTQSKDGSRRANGRDLTLPNGRTLFLGSSALAHPSSRIELAGGTQAASGRRFRIN